MDLVEKKLKISQKGIEKVWNYAGGKPNFRFGFVINAIEQKDLFKFKDKFEKIGELNIIEGLKEIGSLSYNNTYEQYEKEFIELDNQIKAFGYKKFPINVVEN